MPTADYSSYHQPSGTGADGTKLDNFIDAVQATVNGLDTNNLAANAGIKTTQLASVVKTTVSPLAGGPPLSPSDGDVWIATSVDAAGTRWSFQYNAGSASTLKWEFIGGSAAQVSVNTLETTTSTADTDLATVGPAFTLARAGDYAPQWGALQKTTANYAVMDIWNGGTARLSSREADCAATNFTSVSAAEILANVGAGVVLRARYAVNTSGTASFANRWLNVLPVRII